MRAQPSFDLARHVDRPELPADAARPEPGDVRLAGGLLPQVVRRDVARRRLRHADRPRQVVVPVDQDVSLEEVSRVGEGRIVGGAGRGDGREHDREDEGDGETVSHGRGR